MHISSADKKEKPWFLKALKTRRNPFFDKTVRKRVSFIFGKEDSVKETHHGFLSRSISARRQRSLLCRLRTKKKDTLTLVFLFALRWRKRCSDKGYVPQCINYINPYGFNQSRSGRANNRALFIAMSNVRHVDALYMEP